MAMNSYFALLLCLSGLQAAVVSYVSNSECATPQGCDFNSLIWNITGIPSKQDNVIIASDVPITIWINNTLTTLNSLFINSGNVSFVVQSGYLDLVSEFTAITGSYVQIDNSTLSFPGGSIYEMLVINGFIYSNSPSFNNLTMVSSIGNFPQLDVNNLYTNDSTLNVTYGIFGGTWELFDTWSSIGDIGLFIEFFSFTAFDPRRVLYVKGDVMNLGGTVLIGNSSTATFGGDVNDLTVGDNVTLNFVRSEEVPEVAQDIRDIYQLYSLNPLKINILNGTTKIIDVSEPIIADVLVIGTLLVHNLTVHGSIHGPGTLGFAYFTDQPPQMTATDTAVQQVDTQLCNCAGLTATHQFNTSFLLVDDTNITVNAPETYISAPGINGSNFLFFNGSFTQTGGLVLISATGAQPSLVAQGQISLIDVQLNVDIWNYDLPPQRISVMKSLSKKLSIHKVRVISSNNQLPSYSIKTSDGELYLEQETKGESFIKKNYMYFAIGGGSILLVILVLLAIQIRRVVIRRKMYSRINSF